MATFDAGSSDDVTAISLTIAHTISGAGNPALYVGVAGNQAVNPLSVIWNVTETMTETVVRTNSVNDRVHIFERAAPTTGTANYVILYASSQEICAVGLSATDCHQTTPTETSGGATTTTTSLSTDLGAVASTSLLFDMEVNDSDKSASLAAGADQTVVGVIRVSPLGLTGAGSRQAGSAGGVMSWSWTGNESSAMVAVSIQSPAATFDPALMAAMSRPRPDIVFHRPTVVASGMTPPSQLPT